MGRDFKVRPTVNGEPVALEVGTLSYDLSKAQDLTPLIKQRGEVVTFDTGQDNPHAMVMAGKRLFISTLVNRWFIRCNDLDDLTDRDDFQFTDDGFHDGSPAMTYVKETNRVYVLFQHASRTTVAEVNPDTLAWTDKVSDTAHAAGSGGNGGSICSNGTHLFVSTRGSPARVEKYLISDGSFVSEVALAHDNAHAMLYDNEDVFVTGTSTPAWVAKVDPIAMTVTQEADFPAGAGVATDDFTSAGDYLWVGTEAPGGVYTVKKSNLAVTFVKTPVTDSVYMTYFDGQAVWVVSAGGRLMRISEDGQVASTILPDSGPNEIASDRPGRLFITHYGISPMKLERIVFPSLTAYTPLFIGGSTDPATSLAMKFVDVGTRSAGSSEVALTTASIQPNTLAVTKQGVKLKAMGRFAGNSNTKRVKVRLVSTDLFDSGLLAFEGSKWVLEFGLFRTGTNTQDWWVEFRTTDALMPMFVDFGTAAVDETVANLLYTRAQGGAASDVQQEYYELMAVN